MLVSLVAAMRGGRRGFWTMALFALVLTLSACELLAHAAMDRVPQLTPAQQKRAVTTIINHHSFSPPLLQQYYGDGEIPHWVMSESTVVTDNYVRLTADQRAQTGHLWNTEPLDMDAFEIIFGFRAYRQMGGMGADGFAMWIAQPPRFNGNVFGRPANFNGFGILFDSYDNDNRRDNPMVGIIANDGSNTKTFSPEKDYMGETLGQCIFDFRNIFAPNMATARVHYEKGTLSLFLSRNSEVDEQHCFTVTNLPMPVGKSYLAFSGQTGDVSEVHDIIFVHLSTLESVNYDHDVQRPATNDEAEVKAQLYNNDAMNNRRAAETTTEAPTQEPMQQQQQQADIEAQVRAETERRLAELERQRLEAEQLRQQQQQQEQQQQQQQEQEQQQQQQQPRDPAAADRDTIAELERKLADLKRRENRRSMRHDEEDDYGDEDYYDEEDNQPRRRRVRRARTPRRNTVEYED